jgi:hypothetical protein
LIVNWKKEEKKNSYRMIRQISVFFCNFLSQLFYFNFLVLLFSFCLSDCLVSFLKYERSKKFNKTWNLLKLTINFLQSISIKLRIQKKNVWKKWCLQHASHFTRSIKYSQCHPNDNPIIRKKEPKHEKLNLKYIWNQQKKFQFKRYTSVRYLKS